MRGIRAIRRSCTGTYSVLVLCTLRLCVGQIRHRYRAGYLGFLPVASSGECRVQVLASAKGYQRPRLSLGYRIWSFSLPIYEYKDGAVRRQRRQVLESSRRAGSQRQGGVSFGEVQRAWTDKSQLKSPRPGTGRLV
ncbi:hypothetical protein J3F84DRAFT_328327 [Trichoderma pleuroticola]